MKSAKLNLCYLNTEQAFNAPTVAPETGIIVPSIEAEIERQVWNAPRPDSTNIVLDSTRTEQVRLTLILILSI